MDTLKTHIDEYMFQACIIQDAKCKVSVKDSKCISINSLV